MRTRTLKRKLQSKPYLINGLFAADSEKADQIIKEHGYLAVDSMLLHAQTRTDWPAELTDQIKKIRENSLSAKLRRIKTDFTMKLRSLWTFHSRAVVVAVALLLVVVFFTLTPFGRSIAESAVRYVIYIFDKGIAVEPVDNPPVGFGNAETISPVDVEPDTDDEFVFLSYDSIQAFVDDTGLLPVVLKNDSFLIASIDYTKLEGAFEELRIMYDTASGEQVMIKELWGEDRATALFQDENDTLIEKTILDNQSLTGYIDAENNEFMAAAVLPDMTLSIMYKADIDYEVVLQSLAYYE